MNARLAVNALFFLALACAAASLFAPAWAAGTACVAFIVLGLLAARKIGEKEAGQARLLAAIVAVLSTALLASRFLVFAGFASLAALAAGLLVLYLLFKHAASTKPFEASVVSVEGGKAVVRVEESLLQVVPPGLYEVEARGLKKGRKAMVRARQQFFGRPRLVLAK